MTKPLLDPAGAEVAPDVEVEFEQLEQSENGESRIEEGYRVDAKAPQTKSQRKSARSKN